MAPSPKVSDFPSFMELTSSSAIEERNCIWYLTKQHRRCKNSVNKVDAAKALELGAIMCETSPDQIQLERLKEYARLKCCNQARHRAMLADLELDQPLAQRWLRELSRKVFTPSEPQSTPSSSISSTATHDQDVETQLASRTIQTRSRSRQSSQTVTASQRTDISTASISSPFRPHLVPSYQSISTKVRDPLTSSSKTGTIYLFTRSSSPGFIKIGYTKWAAQCRLRDWERTCGYKPILVAAFDEVPHMQKVEQLIHFQLAHAWRVEKQCGKCFRQHQEWFEIGSQEAVTVAKQWVNWMRAAEPYGVDGRLKSIWVEQLQQLDASGIPVTAEALLNIQEHSLQSQPTPLPTILEEIEISETQPDNEPVHDTEMLTSSIIDSPIFADTFTAEPDQCSSRSQSQTSAKTLSHIHILTDYLSAMFMIVKIFAQLSPEVFRLLLETCAASSSSSQNSFVSSTRQASTISSGSQ